MLECRVGTGNGGPIFVATGCEPLDDPILGVLLPCAVIPFATSVVFLIEFLILWLSKPKAFSSVGLGALTVFCRLGFGAESAVLNSESSSISSSSDECTRFSESFESLPPNKCLGKLGCTRLGLTCSGLEEKLLNRSLSGLPNTIPVDISAYVGIGIGGIAPVGIVADRLELRFELLLGSTGTGLAGSSTGSVNIFSTAIVLSIFACDSFAGIKCGAKFFNRSSSLISSVCMANVRYPVGFV